MNHSGADHGFTHPDFGFVIFDQPAIFTEPAERPFDDPALRQQHEAGRADGSQDGLENPATVSFDPANQIPRVAAVGEDRSHPGEPTLHPIQHQLGSVAVLQYKAAFSVEEHVSTLVVSLPVGTVGVLPLNS